MVRVDLQTSQAETVRCVGIHHDDVQSLYVTDSHMFVLQYMEPNACHLLRAPLEHTGDPVELSFSTASIDLSEPVRPIVFKLAGGSTMEVDGRILRARSAYFRE